jgi:hypothetical protein
MYTLSQCHHSIQRLVATLPVNTATGEERGVAVIVAREVCYVDQPIHRLY